MYYGKAESIIIYHRNGDVECFRVGEKYQLLDNSEVIEIEHDQPQGFLGSTQLNIYIKYIVSKDITTNEITKEKEIFFIQCGGDVFIEGKHKKT